ncbi:CMP deaminase [Tannerella sp. oral taxon BU063 isolate Cell 1/3]|uniref:tRNA-specific adenosine deaminase n=1 Tax=Tannerella sp. oral taxon BU063 isolate Cell 1/3 TaxID=1411022 RepID=W2CFV1_9BACT|nr:CMP deaminase [Tannerella sp. oral taxon BU063 isolate Cell 1/3]
MTVQPFNDEYFMRRALDEARQAAAEGEVPVGAVVVCGDRVIARAHNQTERLNDPTAHAEMLAITAATGAMGAKYLPECRLYVTVEPCVMCAGAIGWAQLSAVVYGAPDVKRGFTVYAPQALHPRTEVRGGVMEAECAAEMTAFFRAKR